MQENDDNHNWNFEGANLTKRQTKIVSVAVFFGFLGALVAVLLPFEISKVTGFGIAACFTLVAFYLAQKKIRKWNKLSAHLIVGALIGARSLGVGLFRLPLGAVDLLQRRFLLSVLSAVHSGLDIL